MDAARFRNRLRAFLAPASVLEHEALAPYTTFQVGGPADWLLTVRTVEELRDVLAAARDSDVPITLLGGGSNVVISDEGIRGAVLRLHLTRIFAPEPGRVRAEAGATMNGLVRWTIGRGLAGLEAWAGTPGSVGGAIFGNAHYAGRNIGDLVVEAVLATRDGTLVTASASDLGFAYDTSRLQRTGEILVSADFAVSAGAPDTLRGVARASLAHRKRTQPLALPSAGCMFQNPDPACEVMPDGVPASAGALIDRAGLKGHRVGGASISTVHANFFVNDGTATAHDIHALADLARAAVRDRFGVHLRDEIVFLGHFEHGSPGH